MEHQASHKHEAHEGRKIGHELRDEQYGKASHELRKELYAHPHQFSELLKSINHDLRRHGENPLAIEHDHGKHISGINFHGHDIYGHTHKDGHKEDGRREHKESTVAAPAPAPGAEHKESAVAVPAKPTPEAAAPAAAKPTPEAAAPAAAKPTPEAAAPAAAKQTPEAAAPAAAKQTPEVAVPAAAKQTPEAAAPAAAKQTPEVAVPAAAKQTPEVAAPAAAKQTPEIAAPAAAKQTPEVAAPAAAKQTPEVAAPAAAKPEGAALPGVKFEQNDSSPQFASAAKQFLSAALDKLNPAAQQSLAGLTVSTHREVGKEQHLRGDTPAAYMGPDGKGGDRLNLFEGPTGRRKDTTLANVANHEIGHPLDTHNNNFSDSKEFAAKFEESINKMPKNEQKAMRAAMKQFDRGSGNGPFGHASLRAEFFADLVALNLGTPPNKLSYLDAEHVHYFQGAADLIKERFFK